MLWALVPNLPTMAYEDIAGFSGGHLTGTITLKGPPTPPKRFNLVLNPDPYYCGRISDGKGWRLSPMTQVGPTHALEGAIVYLHDVQKGKPFWELPGRLLKLQNCVFIPYIEVMQVGERLHIENWDPVQHQLEVFLTSSEGGIRLFGAAVLPHPDNQKSDYLSEGKTGIPRPGFEQVYQMNHPGVLFFRCNYHEYMESWSVVVPHPYFARTRETGKFAIDDIPPGSYTLTVWHPQGMAETTVHVKAHDTIDLTIQVSPTLATAQQEDPSKATPFGIDLVGDAHIVPTVELQKWDHPAPKEP
ncbi:MAG: hypothetical protein AB7T38_10935 [Nitrospirales bacterium]